MIDLRSDTVTRPGPAMRRAMAAAEVGDAVLGDDPTVLELEARTADLLGKEGALYMPSGTMANEVAVRAHTRPGDALLLDADSHICRFETGAPAALSGVTCRTLPAERGVFTGEAVRIAAAEAGMHSARPALVCIENTHNLGGGKVWPMEGIASVVAAARECGLRLHMDGARLWNAAAATGIPERVIAAHADSVAVCFSKGLGAPVGSCLVGDAEFIERARRVRQQFGGGMRQAGIVAAGALYALKHHRSRLSEDHENARALARGLAGLPGVRIRPGDVETNLVYFEIEGRDAAEFAERLQEVGVAMLPAGPHTLRAVTSLGITRADVDWTVGVLRRLLGGQRP
ncbi:MAG: low specificity L-threonine aldolase [Kiritimatiellaeota bacterium]|nr:low specificity L-threonine aldolase [Kiritimatiellota bacterium]